ncbi:hypothetical protein NDU88_001583 [Pleurodeles waltl]|uniref:Uncharacterized protein n=1 Tax=Pleurodeles waltl TaxID=8319 RepID=A0AAV7SBB0_PLEWA|nr:hypothetical protein NDU88_001583 [Pleurodeles waltl]
MGRHPDCIGAAHPRLGVPSPGILDRAIGLTPGCEECGQPVQGGGSSRLPPLDFLHFHCWGSLPDVELRACRPLNVHILCCLAWGCIGLEAACLVLKRRPESRSSTLLDGPGRVGGWP